MEAPHPAGEPERLRVLRDYAVLDTPRERDFDGIAELAARICGAPMALITFVDERRQWFKARVGVAYAETPRELAFCAHAIARPQELLVVPDTTRDGRFADNPYVREERGVRFYAGAPLVTPCGQALGTLCVLDRVPRELSADQAQALELLSRQVMTLLRLRRNLEEEARLRRELGESEREQQRRNALLRMVGRVAQIGGWRIELPGREVNWSDEMFALLELPPGKPPGLEQTLELFSLERRAGVGAAIEACVREGQAFGLEAEIQTARQRRIWVQVSGEAERRPDGSIGRVQGTLQDITARKAAESAAGELAKQLTATLESLTDGFFTLDRSWRFAYVNAEAERMLRRPRAALIGQSLLELFPEVRDTVSEREYGRAMREGVATQFETFYPPLGAWFEARAFPSPQGLAVYFRDITAVKLAVDALRASEERFREMAENIGDVFYNFDVRHDRVLYANEAFGRLWGRPMAELLANPRLYLEGIHLEDRAVSLAAYEAQRQGRETDVEYRVQRPDGTIRWVREHAAPIRDKGGRVERIVGTIRDVTERRQDMARITEGEERFRLLAKATRDAIWDWDLLSDAIWWSEGFEIMFGYGREEIEPTIVSWTGRVHPDDRATVVAGIHQAIANGAERWSGEYRFRRKDGAYARVFDRGHIIRDASGRAVRMIGGMADITERHEVAERLRASEQQYRLLFAGNPHPMWVFDTETLRFLAVNDAAVRHYGYSAEEFLRMTILELRASEDATPREQALARMPREGRATGYRRHRKKDGTVIDVEASSDSVVLADRAARLVLAHDITERMRAEGKLREQAALLDKAQDAILVRDLEHRILYCNKSAERLYGWRAADVLNRSVRELLYFEPAVFDEAMSRLRSTGEWVGELVQRRADGEKLMIEGRWTLVRDEAGEPTSVLAINTDITERKKLEQQFLRAQRMESIGTLAGGIAHDLNNLLAPITMGVELLRQFETAEKSRRVIENIERSAKRGTELVKQVLSFARGVEGARVLVHLKHVVREIESIAENTFPKSIAIHTEFPPDLWTVLGDPTQLNQVLLNLCVNARDAMPDGGRLSINLSNVTLDEQYAAMNRGVVAGRYVCLEVADSGCGMPFELQNRIFDPFFTTKETGKGTGLGLSTALGIVRSHGGFMSVYSEPGKGSTFKVCLPAHETPAAAAAAPSVPVLPRGRGETILVVDDEPTILSVTKQTLETFGYRALGAEDGAQAIGLYALHRAEIAVVLTDMMMPVMDGPALIMALRRINPGVRIIAASGLSANGHVARAAVAGVRHFLAKPYTADALLGLLQKVIAGTEEKAP